MTAVDTNVLVRVVTKDDPSQFAAAVRVMKSGDLWVAKTVLLETAWVLEHAYVLRRDVVLDAMRRIVGYGGLVVEDETAVIRALDWSGEGMDFADALHLASSAGAREFVTFDRRLAARGAVVRSPVRVRLIERRG
jgi:predicted nucleic-acid-binding protein